MSHLFVVWGSLKFFKSYGYQTRISDIEDINLAVFCAFWGIANGPLGVSVVFYNNALVLHSLEHMASVIIHFSPSVVMWTLRLNMPLVE